MKTFVINRLTFRAAHTIDGGPWCGNRTHGHDWFVETVVTGSPDKNTGEINSNSLELLSAFVAELDLKDLNVMVPGVFPTPEGLASFAFERLRLECPGLVEVTVGFTGHSATVEV